MDERTTLLLGLAEKIAARYEDRSLAIVRRNDGMWLVALHNFGNDEARLPTEYQETFADALEAFVIAARR